MQKDHPSVKDTLVGAMGNIEVSRMLDPRYFTPDDDLPAQERACVAEGSDREPLVHLTIK